MIANRIRNWLLGISCVAGLPSPSSAGLIAALDFDVPAGNYIEEYYNGGQDGAGRTGPGFGISFFRSTAFSFPRINSESGSGFLAVSDNGAFMNIQDGFDSLTFNYAAGSYYEGKIQFWGGINGTGPFLGELRLTPTISSIINSCLSGCGTEPLTYLIPGIARSAALPYMSGSAVIDDLKVYRSSMVPEPSTAYLLIGCALFFGTVGGIRVSHRTTG